MECFVFLVPPTGAAYVELLHFCCGKSATMTLVVRDPESDPGNEIRSIVSRLESHCIDRSYASSWPGTVLLSDRALILRYRVSSELVAVLAMLRPSLFDWLHPEAPEDPCFYRPDGAALLVTTSHEEDAYLLLMDGELDAIRAGYPTLARDIAPE